MTIWEALLSTKAGSQCRKPVSDALIAGLEAVAKKEGCAPDEAILLLLTRGLEHYHQAARDQRGWEALSDREKQTAALVCRGMTNRQIAATLVISPETVKTHLRHVFRKFGICSRRELRSKLRGWDLSQWCGEEVMGHESSVER